MSGVRHDPSKQLYSLLYSNAKSRDQRVTVTVVPIETR